jgi:hypothetical protein
MERVSLGAICVWLIQIVSLENKAVGFMTRQRHYPGHCTLLGGISENQWAIYRKLKSLESYAARLGQRLVDLSVQCIQEKKLLSIADVENNGYCFRWCWHDL